MAGATWGVRRWPRTRRVRAAPVALAVHGRRTAWLRALGSSIRRRGLARFHADGAVQLAGLLEGIFSIGALDVADDLEVFGPGRVARQGRGLVPLLVRHGPCPV